MSRQEYKIVGVLTNIEKNKIDINLDLPCSELNKKYKNIKKKVLRLNKILETELSNIYCSEDIQKVKLHRPIYYKHFTNKSIKNKLISNMFLKLRISKKCNVFSDLLGSVVEIKAKPRLYNFPDPKENNKLIRGWNFQIISISLLNHKK